ncbi:MAG TPA: response regulator transcription factor [Gemmatimonadaceae bacterium]
MARIVIADDHAIVRRGLSQILTDADDLRLVGEAGTGAELFDVLRSRPVDMVVLDLKFGDRDGIDLLKHIKSEFPHVAVLMLSMHSEEVFAVRALRAGASGYIQKEGAPEMLVAAIRRIASGRTYVSPAMAERLAEDAARGSPASLPHERLSDREFEIFRLLGSGKSVTEIANTLNLSVKTVSTHRTHILEKTGLQTNAAIVDYVTAQRLR